MTSTRRGSVEMHRKTIAILAVASCLSGPAFADVAASSDDVTGAYLGAGIGESRVEAGTAAPSVGGGASFGNFDETHLAYHLVAGVRPIGAPVALELEYLDLGEPRVPPYRGGPGAQFGSVAQRGEGLFLLYYLPTPIVQVYAKAGASRITSHVNIRPEGLALAASSVLLARGSAES
jgi:hypothetical protein